MLDAASTRLNELVGALADGTPVDWTAAESTATSDEERAAIRRLSRIGLAAAWHRRSPSSVRAVSTWSHLQLREKIGQGAFGTVYRARDPRLARDVALKLLHEPMSATGARASAVIEEGQHLARVRHPNIVTVYGAECLDGQVGIWTELIDGHTLHAIVAERGPMTAGDVTAIGIDLCRALAAVHDAGLLHRDIKAQNVMRATSGRIVLMDFGTGRDADLLGARKEDVSGTPLYLAPELFIGGQATVASDIYALAVLLFYLLTGEFPVSGRTLKDVRAAHRDRRARRLVDVRPDTPEMLTRAIEKGLASDPAERYPTARAFCEAFSPPGDVRAEDGVAVSRRWPRSAVVTAAVGTLAGLFWIGLSQSNARSPGIVDAQRWIGQGVAIQGSPSPDGRYLSSVAPDGNLALHDVVSGTNRSLTDAPPDSARADESAISRDGRQVAYSWYDDKISLRTVTFDARTASVPRTLITDPDAQWMVPHDWSPDGSLVAVSIARRDYSVHVGVVATKDASWTELKSLDGRGPTRMAFAPDGQFLAYDLPVDDTPQHDVFVMDLSTHQEIPVVVDRANDEVVGWARAGTSLLFTSDRSGAIGLWEIPFANGAPGPARLIKPDLGSRTFSIGLTAAGALFYGRQTSTENVYRAEVDFTTGQMLSPPVEVVEPYRFKNSAPDWSADGRHFLFFSDRPRNVSVVSMMSTDGAEPMRSIRPALEEFQRPRWAPDRSITVQGRDRRGRWGFFRIDPRSGAAEPIVLAEPRTNIAQASWTPDATRLIYRRQAQDQHWSIVVLNVREQREVELVVTSEPRSRLEGVSLSTNGTHLAYVHRRPSASTLCVVPLSGGPSRTLLQVNQPASLQNVTEWTPGDSRLIYAVSSDGSTSTVSFWSLPVDGGTSVKLEGLNPRLGTNPLRIHPVDGRTVAFTMGENRYEVWSLENFLPTAPATSK